MILSTPKQRQLIGFLRKLLKLSDDEYKDILMFYFVSSSKDLVFEDAEAVINYLKQMAVEKGLYKPKLPNCNYTKYNDLQGRFGYATPKQLRKIEAMWWKISNQPTDEKKEKALNHFVLKIVKKDHIKFLSQSDVKKVIKAIEAMELKLIQDGAVVND